MNIISIRHTNVIIRTTPFHYIYEQLLDPNHFRFKEFLFIRQYKTGAETELTAGFTFFFVFCVYFCIDLLSAFQESRIILIAY